MSVVCKASGLTASLEFRPGRDVCGSVDRLLGPGAGKYCTLEGSWSDRILVSCPNLNADGVLLDVKELGPPNVSPSVNLQSLGPQQLPRLWSGLMDAILYSEKHAGMPKAAQEMADQIASNVVFALDPRTSAAAKRMRMVKNFGGAALQNPKNKYAEDSDDEDGKLYTEEKYDDDPRSLPPCVKEQRAKGKSMHYQLHYNLRLVPSPYAKGARTS
uniref:Uncharacterized protein n=2 Tax=Tetraselmis sp. GSL018 TaxID=582737 RepID=A0A061QZ95_9CHLO